MSNNNNIIIPNPKKYWLGVKREFKYIIQCAKLDKWYAYSPNMFLLSYDISARKEKGENHIREKKVFDLGGISTHNWSDVSQTSASLGLIVATARTNNIYCSFKLTTF